MKKETWISGSQQPKQANVADADKENRNAADDMPGVS